MGVFREASQTYELVLGSQMEENLERERRKGHRVNDKCKDSHFLDFMNSLSQVNRREDYE